MEFNAAQNKFIQDLRTMLPLYQKSGDPKLKAPATNLEWNLKKLTGEYSGETLDAATYATRTKADLALVAGTLAAGAPGQEFASRALSELDGIFGVGGGTVATAPSGAPAATSAGAPTSGGGTAAMSPSDVQGLLTEKAKQSGEELNWRNSVVDLLKLLGKDSSQGARHRYAVALGFPENQISQMPSAEFNTWLHGQLLGLMASNGGNLPANVV